MACEQIFISGFDKPFRLGLGFCILNPHGLVLIGRRAVWEEDKNKDPIWLMPQGGLKKGSTILQTCHDESAEELGLHPEQMTPIATLAKPQIYLFDQSDPFYPYYAGQTLLWGAYLFRGGPMNLNVRPIEKREFSDTRWVPIHEVPAIAVDKKRGMYEQVADGFKAVAEALGEAWHATGRMVDDFGAAACEILDPHPLLTHDAVQGALERPHLHRGLASSFPAVPLTLEA